MSQLLTAGLEHQVLTAFDQNASGHFDSLKAEGKSTYLKLLLE